MTPAQSLQVRKDSVYSQANQLLAMWRQAIVVIEKRAGIKVHSSWKEDFEHLELLMKLDDIGGVEAKIIIIAARLKDSMPMLMDRKIVK